MNHNLNLSKNDHRQNIPTFLSIQQNASFKKKKKCWKKWRIMKAFLNSSYDLLDASKVAPV